MNLLVWLRETRTYVWISHPPNIQKTRLFFLCPLCKGVSFLSSKVYVASTVKGSEHSCDRLMQCGVYTTCLSQDEIRYSKYNCDSPFGYVPQYNVPQCPQIVRNPGQAWVNAESWDESWKSTQKVAPSTPCEKLPKTSSIKGGVSGWVQWRLVIIWSWMCWRVTRSTIRWLAVQALRI